MRVPGVRGNRNLRYHNVIIFQPYPEWKKWLDRDSPVEYVDCQVADDGPVTGKRDPGKGTL